MKTIGLVGGTSWYSTIDYYRLINELVNKELGGNEAAKMVLYSVNYGEIVKLTKAGNWDDIANIIADAAKKLVDAGADCILLGANTMHNIADKVEASISVPLIHIADETAKAIKKKNITTVALLGTKYTMQLDFYKDKLTTHGINTIIPDEEGIQFVNDSIYNELGKGLIVQQTKENYLRLIVQLEKQGAEGVILGCTEIPLLISQEDCSIPVFDTTIIHASAAVDFALASELVDQNFASISKMKN